jgi:predicted alpha/beta hydrolase
LYQQHLFVSTFILNINRLTLTSPYTMSGHGGSDGLHGYVPSLDYVVEDIDVLLGKIVLENPGVPCFLLGHSTGGAVVLKVCLVTISSFSQLYLGQV